MPLNPEELARYSRQIALNEVGAEGQQKIRAGSVLIVGAGGLGSPVALYLAAAGVGRIGLVDSDRVDISNLHRQLLHGTGDVGRPKTASGADAIREINPGVNVIEHSVALSSENAMEILKGYDIVVDGSDNFPTRYLVNDATVFLSRPNIYGSVFRFEGQASVFDARTGPCYRCLYPEPPPPEFVPSCEEGGVLGVVPGIIGLIQATETLKLLAGLGSSLSGRLLLLDSLKMEFRELKLPKNPQCRVCGPRADIKTLIDYEGFCGVRVDTGTEISAKELAHRITTETVMLLDVREPYEWQIAHFEGATLIPLRSLPQRLSELKPDAQIVVYCHVGARSAAAAEFLRDAGFANVKNLAGGIDAWSREVDPAMPRY